MDIFFCLRTSQVSWQVVLELIAGCPAWISVLGPGDMHGSHACVPLLGVSMRACVHRREDMVDCVRVFLSICQVGSLAVPSPGVS